MEASLNDQPEVTDEFDRMLEEQIRVDPPSSLALGVGTVSIRDKHNNT